MTEEIKKKALKAFWDCVYTSVDADTGEALIFGETAFFDVLFNKILASYSICSKEQRRFLDEVENGCIYLEEEGCIYSTTDERSESVLWQDEFKSDFRKVITGE